MIKNQINMTLVCMYRFAEECNNDLSHECIGKCTFCKVLYKDVMV